METISLSVTGRQKEDDVRALRRNREIPCVVYGNFENTSIKCHEQDFHRVYVNAGESTVIELDIEGKKVPVLIHSIDLDPVTDRYEHIDFYAVDMKKEVTANVPIHFIGEAPAVKNLGGVLVTVVDELTVTCLPKDLPHQFDVSLEKLNEFHDSLTVADLTIPANVNIDEEPEMTIATIQEPRAAEPEPTAAPPEGEEGEKKEGEEGKEGEDKAEEKKGE